MTRYRNSNTLILFYSSWTYKDSVNVEIDFKNIISIGSLKPIKAKRKCRFRWSTFTSAIRKARRIWLPIASRWVLLTPFTDLQLYSYSTQCVIQHSIDHTHHQALQSIYRIIYFKLICYRRFSSITSRIYFEENGKPTQLKSLQMNIFKRFTSTDLNQTIFKMKLRYEKYVLTQNLLYVTQDFQTVFMPQ